jgi:cobalt/nickel transport system permease protein
MSHASLSASLTALAPATERRFPVGCDARLKLSVALAAWLVVLSAERPGGAVLVGAGAWLSLLRLGSPGRALRPLRAALFTGAVAVILRLVLTLGEPAFRWHVLGYELAVSHAGIDAARLLAARIVGAASVAAWLGATTPFSELERALAWLRVPAPLLEIASLARRYVSVLEETLHTARAAQTLRLGYRSTRASLASAGVLAGLIVGRALDQSVITGQAMLLRGYRPAQARRATQVESQGNTWLAALALMLLATGALLGRSVHW